MPISHQILTFPAFSSPLGLCYDRSQDAKLETSDNCLLFTHWFRQDLVGEDAKLLAIPARFSFVCFSQFSYPGCAVLDSRGRSTREKKSSCSLVFSFLSRKHIQTAKNSKLAFMHTSIFFHTSISTQQHLHPTASPHTRIHTPHHCSRRQIAHCQQYQAIRIQSPCLLLLLIQVKLLRLLKPPMPPLPTLLAKVTRRILLPVLSRRVPILPMAASITILAGR